jgi:hypothetical protein
MLINLYFIISLIATGYALCSIIIKGKRYEGGLVMEIILTIALSVTLGFLWPISFIGIGVFYLYILHKQKVAQ